MRDTGFVRGQSLVWARLKSPGSPCPGMEREVRGSTHTGAAGAAGAVGATCASGAVTVAGARGADNTVRQWPEIRNGTHAGALATEGAAGVAS